MINNRQGGRRRGRGGQRPPGASGRPEGNRQDNRQRGNAAQLLEKYKSMARDAQLAGDRVQTEYYLQFADHYFRVLGESRARYEEQRRQRGDGDDDDGDEDPLDAGDDDRGSYSHSGPFDRDDEGDQGEPVMRRSDPAPRRLEPAARGEDRDNRGPRGGDRLAQRDSGNPSERQQQNSERLQPPPRGNAAERISLEVIPPSIGADRAEAVEGEAGEEAPRPRRRARRPRNDDGDEGIAPAA